MKTELLKIIEEVMQREMDRWSGGKYSLDIEIRTTELQSRTSEVLVVCPTLAYTVSCAGMTYELTEDIRELNSQSSETVSCGKDSSRDHWRIEFPSARHLYYEATDYFKEEALKRLLEDE